MIPLRSLYRELAVPRDAGRPLVVGGPPALAQALRKALGVGRSDDPRGAGLYVHIWSGHDDEAALKRARRARVPIVALAPLDVDEIPYVLATDVVPLRAGEGFPVDALARAIAARLGEDGAALAARVPVLRRAVAEQLIASFARKNGAVAAAVFVPGGDLPILLRNELRLVARLEQVYGKELAPAGGKLAGGVALGFGLRAVARELLDLIPPDDAEGLVGLLVGRRRLGRRRFQRKAGWAVKGAVAYAGTRALGEAALRRLEVGAPRGHA